MNGALCAWIRIRLIIAARHGAESTRDSQLMTRNYFLVNPAPTPGEWPVNDHGRTYQIPGRN